MKEENSLADFVAWFRHSSPYIHAHRGKTFVVMLPGEAMVGDAIYNIVHDLALLNGLGIRLVVVHGARPQIDAIVAERHIESKFHNGRRVTDAATLQAAIDAVGRARVELEAAFSAGLPNTPMHGASIRVASGNFVLAKPVGILDGIDHFHTGDVRKIQTEGLVQALEQRNIVLLSCLGYSATGEVFNLLAEQVATEVAVALKADKLILFGEQPGLLDDDGTLLHETVADQLPVVDATHPMAQILLAAQTACRRGVPRTHIVSFRDDGSLLMELFSLDGGGTLVTPKPYENIRPATIHDVGGLIELIEPLEEAGVLVKRSRERLEQEITQFQVIDRDGSVIGCAALYPIKGSDMAEIACIVIHPNYRDAERGVELMKTIYQQAKVLGMKKVFVLTTQTAHWFLSLGFVEAKIDDLPAERKALYNYQRNSKVFVKTLP